VIPWAGMLPSDIERAIGWDGYVGLEEFRRCGAGLALSDRGAIAFFVGDDAVRVLVHHRGLTVITRRDLSPPRHTRPGH